MGDASIIKIDKLTEPATKLIEKVSEAIGGLAKPFQIRRVAQAEADADIIVAETQIKIDEIQRRALSRFLVEEAKKQENIERITAQALPLLNDGIDPREMDDDWIINFFDKCRIISDGEMQVLWSKILAGEANVPGTYSKRTVNMMGSLEKYDAELFQNLCRFTIKVFDNRCLLVFDENHSMYRDNGLTYVTLTHLDDIGLISFKSAEEVLITSLKQSVNVQYYGNTIQIEFNNEEGNQLPSGNVIFTKVGEQLCKITEIDPVENFIDYVLERWRENKNIKTITYIE